MRCRRYVVNLKVQYSMTLRTRNMDRYFSCNVMLKVFFCVLNFFLNWCGKCCWDARKRVTSNVWEHSQLEETLSCCLLFWWAPLISCDLWLRQSLALLSGMVDGHNKQQGNTQLQPHRLHLGFYRKTTPNFFWQNRQLFDPTLQLHGAFWLLLAHSLSLMAHFPSQYFHQFCFQQPTSSDKLCSD